jgi:hypothetical protein
MSALGTRISQRFHKTIGLGREDGRQRNARIFLSGRKRLPSFSATHSCLSRKAMLSLGGQKGVERKLRETSHCLVSPMTFCFSHGSLPSADQRAHMQTGGLELLHGSTMNSSLRLGSFLPNYAIQLGVPFDKYY